MRSTKILTTEKFHILEKLGVTSESGYERYHDYFCLGDPLLDPPSVRGSMILNLRKEFLFENRGAFVSGCPVDTGAIRFGFIDLPVDPIIFLERTYCDEEKFFKLIERIEGVSGEAQAALLRHRPHSALRVVLKYFFGYEVSNIMFEFGDNPHMWIFEYALDASYFLNLNHVDALWCPNTYERSPRFKVVRKYLNGRLRGYNPKYGLEACREAWL